MLETSRTSKKILTLTIIALIIFGFGGLTAVGLMFGTVIVISLFICNMCLGSLFAAVGIVTTICASIKINRDCNEVKEDIEKSLSKRKSSITFNPNINVIKS
jgi:hypothetical protein